MFGSWFLEHLLIKRFMNSRVFVTLILCLGRSRSNSKAAAEDTLPPSARENENLLEDPGGERITRTN